ncbi:hypothetical protein, partial [Corynebacterium sanguinis]|uniref:hypothetical protein n=1 Tax=Corynebacterium sanguinis TaxID=2594913 RepID=UPI001C68DDB3
PLPSSQGIDITMGKGNDLVIRGSYTLLCHRKSPLGQSRIYLKILGERLGRGRWRTPVFRSLK